MNSEIKYTHPALYDGTEQEIIDRLPDANWESHQNEADRANKQIIAATLGATTGWPTMWVDEVLSAPPTGEEWLTAARKAQDKIKTGGIILLCGHRGNGKTRMAAEFAIRAGSSRYRTAMRFFLEIRATFSNRDVSELDIIDDLAKTDLLVLDEMQERSETDWENRLLTHLIDARYAEKRPTILISNLTKQQLGKSLSPSVIDRIRGNGVSVEFNWESFRKPQ
jgi:DNA replication protein DnaC